MKRFAYSQLLKWKNSEGNHFLMLGGVPGVGKTSLITKFAITEFDSYYYHDFFVNGDIQEEDFKLFSSRKLIIFDNLMGNKDLLFKLKTISDKYPELYYIVIDPFAKVAKGSGPSVVMNYLVLYPLSFEEFLFNVDLGLYTKLASLENVLNIDEKFNEVLIIYFNDYLIVGGMPSSINLYQTSGLDFSLLRKNQEVILEHIFNKLKLYYKTTEYKNLKKIILSVYSSIVRDNRKFKLSDISASKRFITFKQYIDILTKLNLVYFSPQMKGKKLDIDEKSFILYFFDTGLLGALGKVPESLYNINTLYSNQITEGLCVNFVADELYSTINSPIYSWIHNMSKIEFLLKKNNEIQPLEVKNDGSGKLKSLKVFDEYFSNIKLNRLNLSKPDKKDIVNSYPIYLVKSLYRKFISLN